jgi:hypothetical protein
MIYRREESERVLTTTTDEAADGLRVRAAKVVSFKSKVRGIERTECILKRKPRARDLGHGRSIAAPAEKRGFATP